VRTVALLTVVLTLGLAAAPALAQENAKLAQARRELDALQYDKARDSLAAALAAGDSGPAQVQEIHRLAGEVAAALGDAKGATEHFKRLLALDPNAQPKAGASPKITQPFDAARAWFKGKAPLRVSLVVDPGGAEPTIAIQVESDPLKMVRAARAVLRAADGRESTLEAGGVAPYALVVPGGGRFEGKAAVVDEHGNRLVEMDVVVEPVATPVTKRGGGGGRPLYARWWLWAGVMGAAGATGVIFGLRVLDAQDELDALNADSMNHQFSEAQEIEDRGRRDALIANISFGVAGVAAVAAGYCLFSTLREGGGERRVDVAATPGGALISIAGRF
jgi:hypothetical protein